MILGTLEVQIAVQGPPVSADVSPPLQGGELSPRRSEAFKEARRGCMSQGPLSGAYAPNKPFFFSLFFSRNKALKVHAVCR